MESISDLCVFSALQSNSLWIQAASLHWWCSIEIFVDNFDIQNKLSQKKTAGTQMADSTDSTQHLTQVAAGLIPPSMHTGLGTRTSLV